MARIVHQLAARREMPVSRRLLQTTVPQHAAPAATSMFRDFGTHRNSSGASPWRSEAGSSTVKIVNVPEGVYNAQKDYYESGELRMFRACG